MMEPQHHYADVRSQDHHHDDDSSTEVESLVGGEKQWAAGEYHSRAPPSRRRIMCPPLVAAMRWILVIGLQLVIIGLLARDQGMLDSTRWKARSTSANDVGGDITGWSPHSESYYSIHCRTQFNSHAVPTQITKFEINQTFAPYNTSEFFKPEVLRAWNELLPGTTPLTSEFFKGSTNTPHSRHGLSEHS